ncbi:uncharacterized protein LOC106012714 [Aplysia californica]|uniref:Uncharacterized protein LOC106012714 n=1 Tax=Aplysia californica TaxID=6500 RepID=A0ABM1A6S7_APLCA|nr:uncharacterized protein LOC106012714 [Aplysia californica]
MAAFGTKKELKGRDGRKKVINMNITKVYTPTNDAEEDNKDAFYNRLQSGIDKLPGKDINIVMGDLHAKLGPDNSHCGEIMGRHGLGEANDNGERFQSFCAFTTWLWEERSSHIKRFIRLLGPPQMGRRKTRLIMFASPENLDAHWRTSESYEEQTSHQTTIWSLEI